MTVHDKKGNEVEIKSGAIYYDNHGYHVVVNGSQGNWSHINTKHPYLTKLGILIDQNWKWYWTIVITTYIIGTVNGILLALLLL